MTRLRKPRPPRTRTPPDGFIVVAVLWILGALATLASIYAVYVVDTATAFARARRPAAGRALVAAGVELTAYQMTRDAAGSGRPRHLHVPPRTRQRRGRFPFRDGAHRPQRGAEGAAGRTVRRARRARARRRRLRRPRSSAGARRPGPKARTDEAAAYRAAGLPYAPRGAPFPHVGELALVLGLPAALVERALPILTV